MIVKNKVAVVTGGASGIGLALCTRFAREGASVVLADLTQEASEREAAPIGAFPVATDVGREEAVQHLVEATIERFGRIDLFVSNAGIGIDGGVEISTEKWQKIININLMAQVWAAKYAIPHMIEQGGGYMLNVASAGGLLVIPDTVSYTVTKHASVGFTEWLSTVYADKGISVSLLTPAAVLTPIIAGKEDSPEGQDAITTEQLADIVMEGLADERFLINTHPWVLEKFAIKARDYEEYIQMMRADQAAADAAAAAAA